MAEITYPLTMPTNPRYLSASVGIARKSAQTINPYNGRSQVQMWPASKLIANIQLPTMNKSEAGPWIAFFAKMHGKSGTFYLPVYDRYNPQGQPEGSPVVSSISADGLTVTSSGWAASKSGLLLPGDYIQLPSGELRIVVEIVSSNGSGQADIQIEPAARNKSTTGAIVTANCRGIFELTEDFVSWEVSAALLYGFAFQAQEAVR